MRFVLNLDIEIELKASIHGGDKDTYCADAACLVIWEKEGHGRVCDPRSTHEQAASDLGGLGTPSHGQRHSQVVDEEGVVEGWAK